MRFLNEQDSEEVKYSSSILQEKGKEVENIRISKYSNYFIAYGEDYQTH